jgi:GST-like protein
VKTYTLYGSRGSGSAAVEIALRVVNLPYRVVRASTWEPDSALEELAKVNALRQIPTLVLPEGGILTESAAILIHLGLIAPESGLLPTAVGSRAQAIRGLVFIAANCYAAISINDYPERWTTAKTAAAREKLRAGTRAQLYRNWDIFADTFPAEPYLSGSRPGALDFLAVVVSRWGGARPQIAERRPNFHATLMLIEKHPVVAAVFAEHWGT